LKLIFGMFKLTSRASKM